jgi:hypothetical protein
MCRASSIDDWAITLTEAVCPAHLQLVSNPLYLIVDGHLSYLLGSSKTQVLQDMPSEHVVSTRLRDVAGIKSVDGSTASVAWENFLKGYKQRLLLSNWSSDSCILTASRCSIISIVIFLYEWRKSSQVRAWRTMNRQICLISNVMCAELFFHRELVKAMS